MRKNRTMHFAQFLMHSPTYHSLAMWRHPRTVAAHYDWARPELYQHTAQVCERGKLDMVFFADVSFIADSYMGSLGPAIRYATQTPMHDPTPLLSWLGAVTSTIGLARTFSISHQHPFYATRLWATLDHLTRGRAGWNVVTSVNHNESANYGAELLAHDLRYERAEEFVDVCVKLWNSWAADAVVMDRERGIFRLSRARANTTKTSKRGWTTGGTTQTIARFSLAYSRSSAARNRKLARSRSFTIAWCHRKPAWRFSGVATAWTVPRGVSGEDVARAFAGRVEGV